MVLHSLINLFSSQSRHIRGALLKLKLACNLFIILLSFFCAHFTFPFYFLGILKIKGLELMRPVPQCFKRFQSQHLLPRLKMKSENNSIVFSPSEPFPDCLGCCSSPLYNKALAAFLLQNSSFVICNSTLFNPLFR